MLQTIYINPAGYTAFVRNGCLDSDGDLLATNARFLLFMRDKDSVAPAFALLRAGAMTVFF